MAEPVDIKYLLASYRRYLMAKIQSQEFGSWGDGVTDNFRKAIAEHQETENRYLAQELERRRS